jgi:ribosome maturation factor RimP
LEEQQHTGGETVSKPVSNPGSSELSDRLGVLLAAPLGDLGLDLEGVDVSTAGKRRVLRVAIDKDGGVSLDDVADATRAVSRTLDDADAMGERPYTLEVSSPGVDRPLTLPRHWRRNRDRLVKVTLADDTSVTGRIGDSDDDAVTLDVDGQERRLPYVEVRRAKVQVEFNRPPKEA